MIKVLNSTVQNAGRSSYGDVKVAEKQQDHILVVHVILEGLKKNGTAPANSKNTPYRNRNRFR